MLFFHITHRRFHIGNAVGFQPYIQEPLCNKAKDTGIISRVAGDIQLGFQFAQDIKKPLAVVAEQIPAHNKHIKPMSLGAFHGGAVGRQIVGIIPLQNPFRLHQIRFVVGVNILLVIGFNKLVSLFRQHNRRFLQEQFQLLFCENSLPLISQA